MMVLLILLLMMALVVLLDQVYILLFCSGKIKQNLPPIINTKISLQQLVRYIHYSEEQMNIINWANYHIASSHLHLHHYPEPMQAKASTINGMLMSKPINSTTCRCCQSNKSESIAHIIGCPSRAQTHDEYRLQVTAHFRACCIGDHLL